MLRAGEDNLREYLFNKHAIKHQSCIDCGVEVFANGTKPDGTEVVALNVSCIDGIDLAKLTMTPIDGRKPVGPATLQALTSPAGRGEMNSPHAHVKRPAPCSAGKSPPR